MSKKTKKDATDDGPDTPARVDLSLVTSLSLLAGGLASYPSLQGMIEGKVDAFHAAIWFLGATIIAMIGFSIVASLFHSFSAAHHAAEREKARVEAEEAAGG